MVSVGQLRRELAADPAGGSPGRGGRGCGPGIAHVPVGGVVGPGRPGQVAAADEPAGPGPLPAGDGAAFEPPGVCAIAPVPAGGVAAAGRRAAALHPGPHGPLDGRGVSRHGAPAGGHLRPLPAARRHPRRPASRSPGVRGKLHPDRHPDGGRAAACPRRLRGLGEPADGAPLRPAGGAGGGGGAAPRAASVHRGSGRHRGGAGHGGGGAGAGQCACVRGHIAPAAGGFSGAAPRSGAP